MPPRLSFAAHIRALLTLGLPLVGSNLAQMGLHVADTVMMGWYGVRELASVVLGAGFFWILFLMGSGFSYALMGRVSAALGSGDETQVRRDTRMAIWLSVLAGVLMMPVLWFSGSILRALGQQSEIADLTGQFLRIAMWGMVPALIVAVLKAYLSAFERTRVVLAVTLVAVALNIGSNWLFIFGNLGMPELGLRGAALSSVMVQIISATVLMIYAARLPELRRFTLFARFWRPDWEAFRAVFRVGMPIGLTSVFETSMFQASAVMMGWIGTVQLAAHGIALELASLAFMVHMGLSNAATIRVGRAQGGRDLRGMRDGAAAGLALSFGFGFVTVACFLLLPHQLIGLFLDRSSAEAGQILIFGTVLLAVAGLFQLFDAAQVMALGLLRGVQDTRVPMWVAGGSYWLVGIPASYVLAFPLGLGGAGLWLGLASGLACSAVILTLRFWRGPWLTPRG
ncbi:MATE family efflux transporter [Paenirhodobacter sp.]|uniref:MATE family efflux transporter n=1 Tax=Paenirhodobacter sp. TaxID=1965326 RepID=UPI003B3D38E9